jgi:hypothetical protein
MILLTLQGWGTAVITSSRYTTFFQIRDCECSAAHGTWIYERGASVRRAPKLFSWPFCTLNRNCSVQRANFVIIEQLNSFKSKTNRRANIVTRYSFNEPWMDLLILAISTERNFCFYFRFDGTYMYVRIFSIEIYVLKRVLWLR